VNNIGRPIALALSGGGVRAMVFHLGVLKSLAESNSLERVSHISTVSGGSLILGLMLQENKMIWPTSADFLERILPVLRQKLCTKSLMFGMLRQFIKPQCWRFLFSRANILAATLRDEWGVTAKLSDLPLSPEWSINGTTAENGKRFRFKRDGFGDYILGYASSNDFSLADALAVSAAFPGGIGPLVLSAYDHKWHKRQYWGASSNDTMIVTPPYRHIHLYDGGVYDNLGLEPFLDVGKKAVKEKISSDSIIVVSDSSAPLGKGFSYSKLNPWRIKRVLDIISDQARALRVRTFYGYLSSLTGVGGVYIYIGNDDQEYKSESEKIAINFPTTLRKLTYFEFDHILNHGHQVSKEKLDTMND
jgi:NTE family protein